MVAPVRVELKVTANVPFGNSDIALAGGFPFYALTLERPSWKDWHPGQFIMMRALWGNDGADCAHALPICRATSQGLVLFFRNTSETSRLVRLKPGDKVLAWGPLGNGFAMPQGKNILLLAAEEGIAPFAGYADRHADTSRLFMLFGHRRPTGCYPFDAMASRINMEEMQTDGEARREAFYGSAYEKMEKFRRHGGLCLACGPMDFIGRVWKKALEINMPVQLYVSRKMICGVGACCGCVVPAAKKEGGAPDLPLRACVNGPVFWSTDIDLEADREGGGE